MKRSDHSPFFFNIGDRYCKTMLNLAETEENIRAGKSAATAKNYLAVTRRLRQLAGSDEIPLSAFGEGLISRFRQSLEDDSLQPTTISLFLRALRAICKPAFAAAGLSDEHKRLFADISSANAAPSKASPLADLRKLADADLSSYPLLDNIRDIYLHRLLAYGETTRHPLAEPFPQLPLIEKRFRRRNGIDIMQYAATIAQPEWKRGLQMLATKATLRRPLNGDPDGITQTWERLHKHLQSEYPADTADAILDARRHWYAARCRAQSPAEIASALIKRNAKTPAAPATSAAPAEEAEEQEFTLFIPPAPKRHGKRKSRPALMETLLFVRIDAAGAKRLQTQLRPGATLYATHPGGDPARIPDVEMKLFMLLSEVAPDTLEYHFPGEADDPLPLPDFSQGQRAIITEGPLQGQEVEIAKAEAPDRYHIRVTFTALNGATVTATLPAPYLSPLP